MTKQSTHKPGYSVNNVPLLKLYFLHPTHSGPQLVVLFLPWSKFSLYRTINQCKIKYRLYIANSAVIFIFYQTKTSSLFFNPLTPTDVDGVFQINTRAYLVFTILNT